MYVFIAEAKNHTQKKSTPNGSHPTTSSLQAVSDQYAASSTAPSNSHIILTN
jgi:hypothetical protein